MTDPRRHPEEAERVALYTLVYELGGMTVEELEERMSAHELAEHVQYRAELLRQQQLQREVQERRIARGRRRR